MKLRMLAPLALIAAAVILATMNLTAEAEPSWLERTLAFGLLRAASFAHSLSPRPPRFFAESPRASVAADAYIIRHGIRWTGMPAFRTMSDADAWRVATYLRRARRDTIVDPLFGLRPFLAGIRVPDANSAARWYQENLGFTRNGESTLQHRGVHIVRGITSLPQFQIRSLLIQDPNGNVIQLFDRRT